LWRYPVKSMGAENLAEVEVSWHGLAGDRRWAFIRNDAVQSGAVQSGLPWLTLRERGDMSHYLPSFVEPARPDKSPTLDVQRFRPNILVEAADEAPFAEDGWVGCVLRLGGMRMRVDKRDGRCVVITIDPVTTQRNPAILRAAARDRQGCLGVYGSTVEPGRVAVNDPVLIESPALPVLIESPA
jgi:hypothetical protein